jgi:hypothetical protein
VREKGTARALAWLVGVIAAAAAMIFAVARADDDEPRPRGRPAHQVRASGFSLTVLPGWSAAERAPVLPGIPFTDPVVLVQDVSRLRLVADTVPATSPTLLPASLLRRLRWPPGKPEKLRLRRNVHAFFYSRLAYDEARAPLDLYVVPTTEGVATLACVAQYAFTALAGECRDVARTLTMPERRALRLRPDTAFRQRLSGALERLDRARGAARAQLARARTARAQALALAPLAETYRAAAESIARVAPASAALPRRTIALLKRTARDYQRLGISLQDDDDRAFARHRDRARRSEAHLRRLVTALTP